MPVAMSTYTYVTYIRATPKTLWHALTANEVIGKYWFGLRIDSDWKVGSTWKFHYRDELMDSGEIIESVYPKRLVRSWRNEWRPEFKKEGISRCVYEIKAIGSCVKLTITHSIKRKNSKFIEAVSEGWPMCMSNLKSLLETGKIALVEHPGH
jgi:uncharacterized protein YndB with AHSA1/START domain